MNAKKSKSRTSPNNKFHTTSKRQNELCRRAHAPKSTPLPRHSSLSQESTEVRIWAYLLPTRTCMAPVVLDMMSAEAQQMLPLLQSNERMFREYGSRFVPAMMLTLPLKISPEGREQIKSLLELVGDESLALIASLRFSGPPCSDCLVSEYGVAIDLVGLNTVGPKTNLFKTIRKADGSSEKKQFEDHEGYTADIHELEEESHPGHCKACLRRGVYNMFSDARFLDSFSVMAKRVLDECVEEGKGRPSGRHVLAVVGCVMEAYHDEYEPWLPFGRRSDSAKLT